MTTIKFMRGNGQPLFVSLANPNESIKMLANPDAVAVHSSTIKIAYTYPFSTGQPEIIVEKSPSGFFTYRSLIAAISQRYELFYREADDNPSKHGLWVPLNQLTINKICLDPINELWFLCFDD
jgi:hypothetical protein